MQYQVESSLIDQVTATAAKGGMAVVVDVHTGDVVAMATVDGATNGVPAHAALAGEDTNRPLTDLFEPGSTNKLITIATAIEHGKVGPNTEFNVPASINVGAEKSYSDVAPRQRHRALVHDRHPARVVERRHDHDREVVVHQRRARRRAPELRARSADTRSTSPGSRTGSCSIPTKYYTTGLAASAIGYSVAVTAMQMLDVYATFANGGVTVPPRLLDATIDEHGDRQPIARTPGQRVVSQKTATTMSQMLGEVVRNGTGACASIPGYTVAGKTGTSRKAAPQGGYTSGTMASFVGFAPAQRPALRGDRRARRTRQPVRSVASAPVFSEIVQAALTQYRVAARRHRRPEAVRHRPRVRRSSRAATARCRTATALTQVLAQQGRGRAGRGPGQGARPNGDRGGAADHRRGRDARYCRRRHVPERVGGRVRMHDLLDGLDVLAVSR